MTLTPAQLEAIRDLETLWPGEVVIIGAGALGFYFEMQWRRTADIDFVVHVGHTEFPGPLVGRTGWSQGTHAHQYLWNATTKIDIVPLSYETLQAGQLTWPSGHVMNLAGTEMALRHAVGHVVPGDLQPVRVAPPHILAALKMVSYLDRPAERERDLADIAHLLDQYIADDAPRRFEDARVPDALPFELVAAFLMGLDLQQVIEPDAAACVDRFLATMSDPDSSQYALMERKGPQRWTTEAAGALHRRLEAFALGRAAG